MAALAGIACSGTVHALSPAAASALPLRADEPTPKATTPPNVCEREIVLNPDLQGEPGFWMTSRRMYDNEGGCPTYPKWTITGGSERAWRVYRRPHDIGNGQPDPDHVGNYAGIFQPGTYVVSIESAPGSVTTITVTVPPSVPPCHRNTIVNPPEMAGGPGLWFHSDPDGSAEVPPEGCPSTYPRWSVTPSGTRFHVFHRPHDATSGNEDPQRIGNWANITNPTSGKTYTVRTEYGKYSTVILVTAP